MNNILDKIKSILDIPEIKLGVMPHKPDNVIALFEYPAKPPEHYFNGTNFIYGIQVRIRNKLAVGAYTTAADISNKLNRYHDTEISIIQSTPILDIGKDDANPQRHEYTINFEIRRY